MIANKYTEVAKQNVCGVKMSSDAVKTFMLYSVLDYPHTPMMSHVYIDIQLFFNIERVDISNEKVHLWS